MSVVVTLIRLVLGLAALGLGAVAIAAWFGFAVPIFDLFNHFQIVLVAGLIVLLLAVLVLFGGSAWQSPLGVLLVAGLVASGLTVVPETLLALAPRPALPTDGRPVIRLMTHNLFGLNYDMERVARVIAAEHPDIIALQEFFVEQRERLPPLIEKDYPYSAYCVGGKRANIAIYSKLPFTQTQDGACTTDEAKAGRTSHLIATFVNQNGTEFSILTTHFDWPFPIDRQRQERDAIVTALKGVTTPVLVVGDFNSAPWSYAQRDFADAAGLTRQTHGQLTWPMRFWIKGYRDTLPFIPLDQVMSRGAIVVHDLHTAAATGSDHLPVVVTFSVGK